jgi:hypothetical protein
MKTLNFSADVSAQDPNFYSQRFIDEVANKISDFGNC